MDAVQASSSATSQTSSEGNAGGIGAGSSGNRERSNVNEFHNSLTKKTNPLLTQLLKAYGTLSRRQNDHLLLLADQTAKLSDYQHKRRFAEQSVFQMIATFSSQRLEGMQNTPEQSFASLKAQLIGDGAELEKISQAAMAMQSQSSSAQYSVAEATAHFMTVLEQFICGFPGGFELWLLLSKAAKDGWDHVSEVSEDIPPQAQKFFDAIGEFRLLQEQLVELQQQLIDERAERDFLRDQENEPSTPDSIFESGHESAQKALWDKIRVVLHIAGEAKGVCERDGIDLDALRHRDRSETDEVVEEGSTPTAFTLSFANLRQTGSDIPILKRCV